MQINLFIDKKDTEKGNLAVNWRHLYLRKIDVVIRKSQTRIY